MADANGWPDSINVLDRANQAAPTRILGQGAFDAAAVLAAVIAEFQSPPGRDNSGGTGRSFVPVTEARAFDGQGYPELIVGDYLPSSALTVSVLNGSGLSVHMVNPSPDGAAWDTIALVGYDDYSGGYLSGGYGSLGFPRGRQNILVSATWGYAAAIPADVYEAVLCEAASRVLVHSSVPLTGVGESIKLETFEINTSSGISAWEKSSPIAVMHTVYEAAVKRYRITSAPAIKRLAASRRMS